MTAKEMSDFINSLWCWERCTEEEQRKLSVITDYLSSRGNEKSALDKVRAEIEQLPTSICTETHRIHIDADDFKENVLAILDKYKAEQGGIIANDARQKN